MSEVDHVRNLVTVKHVATFATSPSTVIFCSMVSKFLFPPRHTSIKADEKLIAVYGCRLAKPGSYDDRKCVSTNRLLHLLGNPFSSFSIVQLSFIIAKFSGNDPTVEVLNECYECTKCQFLTNLLQLLLETPGNPRKV